MDENRKGACAPTWDARTIRDAFDRAIRANRRRVRESVFEGKFQLPKTLMAAGTIPLGRHALVALKAHRERAIRTAPEDLAFGNRGGKPLRESKLLRNVLQPRRQSRSTTRL